MHFSQSFSHPHPPLQMLLSPCRDYESLTSSTCRLYFLKRIIASLSFKAFNKPGRTPSIKDSQEMMLRDNNFHSRTGRALNQTTLSPNESFSTSVPQHATWKQMLAARGFPIRRYGSCHHPDGNGDGRSQHESFCRTEYSTSQKTLTRSTKHPSAQKKSGKCPAHPPPPGRSQRLAATWQQFELERELVCVCVCCAVRFCAVCGVWCVRGWVMAYCTCGLMQLGSEEYGRDCSRCYRAQNVKHVSESFARNSP